MRTGRQECMFGTPDPCTCRPCEANQDQAREPSLLSDTPGLTWPWVLGLRVQGRLVRYIHHGDGSMTLRAVPIEEVHQERLLSERGQCLWHGDHRMRTLSVRFTDLKRALHFWMLLVLPAALCALLMEFFELDAPHVEFA